jgi:mannosyl-oligosaccharide glucosidase
MAAAARIMNTIQDELDLYYQSSPSSESVTVSQTGEAAAVPALPKSVSRSGAYNYQEQYALFQDSADRYHWSDELQGYFDVGLNNEEASYFTKEVVYRCSNPRDNSGVDVMMPLDALQKGETPAQFCPKAHPKPLYPLGDGNGGLLTKEKFVTVDLRREHIPRVGYVNLYPLLLSVIRPDDSAKLTAVMEMMENPLLLWSEHGLRSIAASDVFYKRWNSAGDAPYWR